MTKLVQISDLHLMAATDRLYRGYNVESHLQAVLAHLRQHHGDAELILATGDLVHQGGEASYRRLSASLDGLERPWYWIPGNHDDRRLMARVQDRMPVQVQLPGWRLTLLDSTSEPDGRGAGTLAADQLDRLAETLEQGGNQLLVLHHNPIEVDSPWQEAISLANRQAFFDLLDRSEARGAVLFGHLHQTWDLLRGGWRMLGCPSTAVQFCKDRERPVVETSGVTAWPGYRWLKLEPDGRIDTGVERCDPDQSSP